ncbi:MAG: histidine phosphatase family protein [Pseudomonadota bacterium]
MILIRHGQSEFNQVYSRTRVDPGIPDPRLTEEGRRQAALAAEALAARKLKRILASPYTRALETAHIIADRLSLPVAVEPLVREHCRFNCDIGSLRSRLARAWPWLDFAHLDERWWHQRLDESEAELAERSGRFRARMAEQADWSEVAVVTHWGFIRSLTGTEVTNGALLAYDPVEGLARALGAARTAPARASST